MASYLVFILPIKWFILYDNAKFEDIVIKLETVEDGNRFDFELVEGPRAVIFGPEV